MKQEELCRFKNLVIFLETIREDAIRHFLLAYDNASEFIEKYDIELINYDTIKYLCKRYIRNYEGITILKDDYERSLREVYKELVEQVLNKLVDEGTLELCWNSKEKTFFWREVQENRDGRRRYKKENRRRL